MSQSCILESLARSVDMQSTALPLCYGCPLKIFFTAIFQTRNRDRTGRHFRSTLCFILNSLNSSVGFLWSFSTFFKDYFMPEENINIVIWNYQTDSSLPGSCVFWFLCRILSAFILFLIFVSSPNVLHDTYARNHDQCRYIYKDHYLRLWKAI